MNDLEEAFNQITTIKFLIEMLQKAVTANDTQTCKRVCRSILTDRDRDKQMVTC